MDTVDHILLVRAFLSPLFNVCVACRQLWDFSCCHRTVQGEENSVSRTVTSITISIKSGTTERHSSPLRDKHTTYHQVKQHLLVYCVLCNTHLQKYYTRFPELDESRKMWCVRSPSDKRFLSANLRP